MGRARHPYSEKGNFEGCDKIDFILFTIKSNCRFLKDQTQLPRLIFEESDFGIGNKYKCERFYSET